MKRRTFFATLLAGIAAPFVKAAPFNHAKGYVPATGAFKLAWGKALNNRGAANPLFAGGPPCIDRLKIAPLVLTPEQEALLMKAACDARNRLRHRLNAEGRFDFWTPNQ